MAKDAKGHGSETHGGGTGQAKSVLSPFVAAFNARHAADAASKWQFSKDPNSGQMTGSRQTGAHSQGVQATPQLQRRHFEAIAADLKNAPDAGSPAHAQRVSDMANKLSTTNPGFRRDFFVAAATPGGAYRNKGPGKNAAAVQKTVGRYVGKTGKSAYGTHTGSIK